MRVKLIIIVLLFVLLPGATAVCLAESDCENENEEAGFPALEKFHTVMAKMWHKHLPDKDYDAIRKSSTELNQRMEDLKKAELPKSLSGKADAVKEKIGKLGDAVDALSKASKGKDDEMLGKTVVTVHEAYHALVMVIYEKSK